MPRAQRQSMQGDAQSEHAGMMDVNGGIVCVLDVFTCEKGDDSAIVKRQTCIKGTSQKCISSKFLIPQPK